MQRIDVRARAGRWVVRIQDASGHTFQYAYASEQQARYFAAVYRLQRAYIQSELRARKREAQLSPASDARAAPTTRV
jgi:hypothetical protein